MKIILIILVFGCLNNCSNDDNENINILKFIDPYDKIASSLIELKALVGQLDTTKFSIHFTGKNAEKIYIDGSFICNYKFRTYFLKELNELDIFNSLSISEKEEFISLLYFLRKNSVYGIYKDVIIDEYIFPYQNPDKWELFD